MAAVRVVTMNIWGVRGDWPRRRAVLAGGLRALRPHLVAFQEEIRTGDYDQTRDVLGDDYTIVRSEARETDGQGIAIACRWPIADVREIDLDVGPRTAGFACTALAARVDAPVGRLLFVNHFPSWRLDLEAERERQAVRVARAIDEIAGADTHVIVCGDLDADPSAASVRFWCGRQSLDGTSVCYRDAWERVHPPHAPGDTYTPDNPLMVDGDWPFRRIDYILVRCGPHGGPTLPVRDCRRLFHRPVDGVWASDHFGLLADLDPPVNTSIG